MPKLMSLLLFLLLLTPLLSGCPEEAPEAEAEAPDFTSPLSLIAFSAEASTLRVKLTWEVPDEEDSPINKDLDGLIIVRAEGQYPEAIPMRGERYVAGDALGFGVVIANLEPEAEGFSDENIEAGDTYFYEAFTYDGVPNYSDAVKLNSTPGSLVQARLAHIQADLLDGRVLLCGGISSSGPLDTGEIFDPETTAFRPLIDDMISERFSHTATVLNDGRVLLVGGYVSGLENTLTTAEIFNPAAESFGRIESEMDDGRAMHTATLLPDGQVLIVGGTDGVDALNTMALFNPSELTFTTLESTLVRPRYGHRAALVGDIVYILGGFDGFETLPYAAAIHLDFFEVTDLVGNPEQETQMLVGRLNPTLNELPDGAWLVAGGFTGTVSSGDQTDQCEIFMPEGPDFFKAAGSLDQARSGHAGVSLDNGMVLLTGGIGWDLAILSSAEIYDPETGAFSETGNMRLSRTVHGMSLLPDGRALVTGGNRSVDVFNPEPASTAEIYDPLTGVFTVVGAH